MSKAEVTINPWALKEFRRKAGMSQDELAERASVSGGLIALIETGRRSAGMTNALSIARALDVNPRALGVWHLDLDALGDLTEGVAS